MFYLAFGCFKNIYVQIEKAPKLLFSTTTSQSDFYIVLVVLLIIGILLQL